MHFSEMEFLSLFGWNSFFSNSGSESQQLEPSWFRARVIGEERGLYRIQWDHQEIILAAVAGKLQFTAISRAAYPAVGDWVWAEVPPQASRGLIHQICPRQSTIQRKQVGSGSDQQILATNVDYIFVTTSLNEELNLRRLERYLTLAWESGAVPIILLTKADICSSTAELVASVRQEFAGVDVHSLSKEHFAEANFFADYLKPGKTAVVLGSSGVGKSTLVNFLIGKDIIRTQDISDVMAKGRHTTTSRSLYLSRYGGLIIDTPGMRELQLSSHADGVKRQFSGVEDLFLQCRFSDCQHQTEPGCAIKQALEDGSLPEERWKSYLKLAAEVRHEMRKQDKAYAAAERKVWKKRSVAAKTRSLLKKSY